MGVCSSNSKIKHPPTNTNQKPLTEFDGFVVGLKEKENKLTQNLQNEKNTNSKPKGENQSLELNDDYPQHIKEEENKNLTGGLKGRPPGNYVGVSYDPTPVRINPNNVGVSFDQTPVQNCAVDAYDQQQIRRNPNNAGFSYDPTPVRLSQNVAYDYEPQNYQITPTTLNNKDYKIIEIKYLFEELSRRMSKLENSRYESIVV